jgi:hypothetical protein
MDVEIYSTTVTPTAAGSVVQLYVSDAPLEAQSASIVVQMTVSLPEYEGAILLAQAQREAIVKAQAVLREQAQKLANEIGKYDFPPSLEPQVKSV